MGSAAILFFYLSIMAVFVGIFAENCSLNLEGCVKCDASGIHCIKCRHVMEEETRLCRTSCGSGQNEGWSTRSDVIGRICLEAGLWATLGLSGQGAAVVVGCLVGVALSVLALMGGVVYLRRRSHSRLLANDDGSDSTLAVTPINQQERREFLVWLGRLRGEAPTYLAMLNETRAQARNASSLQPYKPVLRDLMTLLLLLNTPDTRVVTPPPDWRRLLAWADRVLKRYKRQSQLTNTAVGELVSFLPYNTMSTTSTSTLQSRNRDWAVDSLPKRSDKSWNCNNNVRRTSLLDTDDGLVDPSPVVEPHNLNRFSFSHAELAGSWENTAPNVLPLWSVPSREVLHEDDYGKLGFRPQDEITTEL